MKCHDCGQWMRVITGVAWKMVYSGWPLTPDREIYRCTRCTEKLGEFHPQHGIKPEFSCGLVK
jgi:DNA-directed RNA polymerase subunit RPC12/RpoP